MSETLWTKFLDLQSRPITRGRLFLITTYIEA